MTPIELFAAGLILLGLSFGLGTWMDYRARQKRQRDAWAFQDHQAAERAAELRQAQIMFRRDWSQPAPKGFHRTTGKES